MSVRNKRAYFGSCLCFSRRNSDDEDGTRFILDNGSIKDRLADAIRQGDLSMVEGLLSRARRPKDLILTVKRRHLNPSQCWIERVDPFLHFSQECSPILWAVDCQQWRVIPILHQYGLDPSRPQLCKRWASPYYPGARQSAVSTPYKDFWARGKFTYQSALDYFFASMYECHGDSTCDEPNNSFSPFTELPELLANGVDVHRIDSVIIFNQLASQFDRYLSHYTNENAVIPDIPETEDSYLEMSVMRTLVENGFSEFECMEFVSPCHSWFGILLCLLCHPKMDSYAPKSLLPPIFSQAALLLINLIAMRCSFPTPNEFEDNLEYLQLRKLYTKRYSERRTEFNDRLQSLRRQCLEQKGHQPQSLKLIARTFLRRQIGGVRFRAKVQALPLPQQLVRFIMYIEADHLKSCSFPPQLVDLACGENIHLPPSPDATL